MLQQSVCFTLLLHAVFRRSPLLVGFYRFSLIAVLCILPLLAVVSILLPHTIFCILQLHTA